MSLKRSGKGVVVTEKSKPLLDAAKKQKSSSLDLLQRVDRLERVVESMLNTLIEERDASSNR